MINLPELNISQYQKFEISIIISLIYSRGAPPNVMLMLKLGWKSTAGRLADVVLETFAPLRVTT
jgi:hypothetical protein